MLAIIKKQVTKLTTTINVLRIAIALSCSTVLSSLKLPMVYFHIVQALSFTAKTLHVFQVYSWYSYVYILSSSCCI